MKIVILLLAAGSGERYKIDKYDNPKQLERINEKTIIEICIENLLLLNLNTEILTVVSKSIFSDAELICKSLNVLPPIVGGNTRQESVKKGLNFLNKFNPLKILIHDVARPYVSKLVVDELIKSLDNDISCVVPCLNVSDSLTKIDKNNKLKRVNKNKFYLIQTPQICNFKDLKYAHDNNERFFDDESSLLSKYGYNVKTITGDPKSLKITYKKDFELIKKVLQKNMSDYITKIGIGYDVHKLVKKSVSTDEKKKLILGGLEINNDYYLEGHSDADVLLHSITDSIYGSINDRDIGYYFPPNEDNWKDCDSFIFLNHALERLEKKGGIITSIDSVIITEIPKILDIVDKIKDKISMNSKIEKKYLSIKGKSNEGIGFIGRKEGIAVLTNTSVLIPNEH